MERRLAITGLRVRDIGATRCQQPGKPARPGGLIPHGAESAPTADEGQRRNLGTHPRFRPSGDG